MKTLICLLAFAASLAAQTYVDAMFPWPNYRGGPTGTAVSMETDEKIAITITAKKACSVSAVRFNLAAVTSAQSTTVTLQNIDASGYPDQTADQTATVATPAAGWNTATMGAARTVAAGDKFAVEFAWTSTAGAMTFTTMNTSTISIQSQDASFYSKYAASAWSKTGSPPVVGLECDDGSFIPTGENTEPWTSTLVDFASNSNPDEIGNRVQVPFGCKVCGATWFGRFANTSATADLVLYDASGNSITSCSLSGALTLSTTTTNFRSCYWTAQTLTADTTYYIMLKPTTTNTVRYYPMVFPTANALQAAPAAASVYRAYRTDGGSISTAAAERASVFLEVCQVATTAAAGGATAHTWVQ